MRAQTIQHIPNLPSLREQLSRLNEQIAGKEVQREAIQQSLPRVILEHPGDDLAGAAERRKLTELSEEIRQLEIARTVLESDVHRAHQWEINQDLNVSLIESRRLAEVLKEKAQKLQSALSQIVALANEVKDADTAFCDSLGGAHPSGFQPHSLSVGLIRRIETILYVESDGALRPRGFMDNAYQLREQGYADLARVVLNYTTVALKDRRILETAEERADREIYEQAQKMRNQPSV